MTNLPFKKNLFGQERDDVSEDRLRALEARIVALEGAPWIPWTPTWTNVTLGAATQNSKYRWDGGAVHYRVRLTLGAGSAITGLPTFTLPVPAHADYTYDVPIGIAVLLDAGIAGHPGSAVAGDGTNIRVFYIGAANAANAPVSSTVPFTWGSDDQIQVTGTYEPAA